MKKHIIITLFAACLALASCGNKENNGSNNLSSNLVGTQWHQDGEDEFWYLDFVNDTLCIHHDGNPEVAEMTELPMTYIYASNHGEFYLYGYRECPYPFEVEGTHLTAHFEGRDNHYTLIQ